jgi:hypothetical protein
MLNGRGAPSVMSSTLHTSRDALTYSMATAARLRMEAGACESCDRADSRGARVADAVSRMVGRVLMMGSRACRHLVAHAPRCTEVRVSETWTREGATQLPRAGCTLLVSDTLSHCCASLALYRAERAGFASFIFFIFQPPKSFQILRHSGTLVTCRSLLCARLVWSHRGHEHSLLRLGLIHRRGKRSPSVIRATDFLFNSELWGRLAVGVLGGHSSRGDTSWADSLSFTVSDS